MNIITHFQTKKRIAEMDGVELGNGVKLGDGVKFGGRFLTIQDKYVCHIYPAKNDTLIRIGCEIHDIPTWDNDQWDIAKRHADTDNDWYEATGQYIYQLLKGEAERFLKQRDNV